MKVDSFLAVDEDQEGRDLRYLHAKCFLEYHTIGDSGLKRRICLSPVFVAVTWKYHPVEYDQFREEKWRITPPQ